MKPSRANLLMVLASLALAVGCGGGSPDEESTATVTGESPGALNAADTLGGNAGRGSPTASVPARATSPAAASPTATTSRPATSTPGPPFPVDFTTDQTAHTVTSANPCGTPVSLAVRGGKVDTGIPTDPELPGFKLGKPGDKYVYLTFRGLGISGECGGAALFSRNVRLEVDGLPTEPANNVSVPLSNGEGKDFVAVYVVDPKAREFRVLLGEAGETVAAVDLEVPTFRCPEYPESQDTGGGLVSWSWSPASNAPSHRS